MLKTVSTANGLVSPTFSGNVTLSNGNLVQGTSGKGINFTANTPAAGMTSQLLNWYEEGNWTPVVTSTIGSITSYTATAAYTRIGQMVMNIIRVEIGNNGTGAGALLISGFPYAARPSVGMSGATREDLVTGVGICASRDTSTSVFVATTANTYPVGTGQGFTLEIAQVV